MAMSAEDWSKFVTRRRLQMSENYHKSNVFLKIVIYIFEYKQPKPLFNGKKQSPFLQNYQHLMNEYITYMYCKLELHVCIYFISKFFIIVV